MFLLSFRAAPVRDSSFIEKMKKTVSCLFFLQGVLGILGSSCPSQFPLKTVSRRSWFGYRHMAAAESIQRKAV